LCLALVFVSVSQWILSVKNCGAIVVLEIQHQGQHQTFLLVLLFHNDLTSASGLYDKSLFCNDLNWASDLYDKSLFQHIFRSYMQAFMAACEDGLVAWHSGPSVAYRPSLVCLSFSERRETSLLKRRSCFLLTKQEFWKSITQSTHSWCNNISIYIHLFSGV
jgi:hypothetical protein